MFGLAAPGKARRVTCYAVIGWLYKGIATGSTAPPSSRNGFGYLSEKGNLLLHSCHGHTGFEHQSVISVRGNLTNRSTLHRSRRPQLPGVTLQLNMAIKLGFVVFALGGMLLHLHDHVITGHFVRDCERGDVCRFAAAKI